MLNFDKHHKNITGASLTTWNKNYHLIKQGPIINVVLYIQVCIYISEGDMIYATFEFLSSACNSYKIT